MPAAEFPRSEQQHYTDHINALQALKFTAAGLLQFWSFSSFYVNKNDLLTN